MDNEDLLHRRFKVIADYPNSAFEIGEIVMTYNNNMAYVTERDKEDLSIYPHLFKVLKWYEEREEILLPKYVKLTYCDKIQYVHKVESWNGFNDNGQRIYSFLNRVDYLTTACISSLEPADEKEFNDYQSTFLK